jgi:membrane protein YdbS with pleckstrin-like domain
MLLWFRTASSIVAWLSAVITSNIKLAFFWLFIVIALILLVASIITVFTVPSQIRSKVF